MTEPQQDPEATLRGLMTTAADMTFPQIHIETIRRGALRRRRAASAAAVAAVLLISGVGVALAAQRNGQVHGPSAPGTSTHSAGPAHASGVPHFYIVRTSTAKGEFTTVRTTATGAAKARVRCPVGAANAAPWPVAPAARQTFFLVCQVGAGRDPSARVSESRVYRFQVTRAGGAGGYVPVRGGTLAGLKVQAISATPDGSEIAVMVYPGSERNFSPATPINIIVINTRTGARATWHAARPVPGKTVYWPQQISLTADGHRVAFLTTPQCFHAKSGPRCAVARGQQVRVIDHPATGGQLNGTRVLAQFSSILNLAAASVMNAVISPDGSTLTLSIVGNLAGNVKPDSVSVVRVRATGPGRPRVVYRMLTGNGYQYTYFSADPSVSHFLLGAGPLSHMTQGRIANGRLVPLKPAAFTVMSAVW
jgi:hypothetical protein